MTALSTVNNPAPSAALQGVLEVLRQNRDAMADRCVGKILDQVPRYAAFDPSGLRGSVDAFLEELFNHGQGMMDRVIAVARQRLAQGLSPSDYLRALLVSVPAAREVVREHGPSETPGIQRGFEELEAFIMEWAAQAANVFQEASAQQLEKKNQELNRLNQRLAAQERALAGEVAVQGRALASAQEFSQRVIESLSSGLCVVGADLTVTMYTARLEQIVGIPAEQVLGKNVMDVLAPVKGLDIGDIITTLRKLGRLPTTKMTLVLPDRTKVVHVHAHRLKDEEGQGQGSVVVVDDVSERELLVDQFSRYVSKDLVQRLLARAQPLGLGGEKRVCTVVFADIRGFTTLAEHMPPDELHQMLNLYLRLMIDGIISNGGFVDKFVGDKVMALFASNRDPADNTLSACRAAVAIKQRIAAVNKVRREHSLVAIEVGIGVNTGEVLLGNVGSEERMDFTAIGDVVNVADRLQSLARGGEVLATGGTRALVKDRFEFVDKGSQILKGRGTPVQVFELVIPAAVEQGAGP